MLKGFLLTSSIAGLLAVTSSAAVADHDRRGFRNDHRWDNRWDNRWDRRNRHFQRGGYWRQGRYFGPRGTYFWGPNPYRGWGQAYVGGALLGSALTYSVIHSHADCSDRSHNHSQRQSPVEYRDGPRYEIEGCYRVEQLPDGRERRVDLPLADCR